MKFSFDEKALFYHELTKLSAAGFPVPEALDAIADTNPPAATMAVVTGVKMGLSGGQSIAAAFADLRDPDVTDLEQSIIASAERGGVLADGFEHLADYFRMRESTAKTMVRKLRYPLILLHVAVLIPVIPLMISAENKLFALGLSLLGLAAAYLVLFFAIVIGRRMAKKAETDAGTDGILGRLPLVGSVRQNLALSRFASVFRMHLLAGERIDEGLRSAAKASHSGRVLKAVEDTAIPAVSNGQPVGPELVKHPEVFTATFARGFVTAEHSGTLDSDLSRWAQRFQEAARTSMDKLGSRAPMFFYGFVLVIVLWQIYRLVALIFGFYAEAFERLDDI